MQELVKSFSEWFKEKTNSPLYSVFAVAFISWNWKVFYILFFETNIKNTTHVEYAQNFSRLYFYYPPQFFGNFYDIFIPLINLILIFLFIFVVPIITTYLIIWELPILSNHAHKVTSQHKILRRKQDYKDNTDYQIYIASLKTDEAEAVVKKAKAEVIIKDNLSQEDKWIKEYNELESNTVFISKFQQILDSIYQHSGYIEVNRERYVDVDILTLAHINELIEYKEGTSRQIELTQHKGKFFANLYITKEVKG